MTQPTATNAVAIGPNATVGADAVGSVALGSGAQATAANSVAVGAGSVTDATLAALQGNAASNPGVAALSGVTPAGEVSVGAVGSERRLTNVAAGSVGTDAVNVSQLQSLAGTVNAVGATAANSVQYDNAGKTSVTLGGPTSTDGGATGGTKLTNVAQGALSTTSTDAVNGAQLNVTNTNVTSLATNITNGTVGPVQRTATANQLALIAPGGTGAAPGEAQNLTNVAAGALSATSTDGVNGSQLFATNNQVANNTTAITNLNNGTAGLVQQASNTAPVTVAASSAGTQVNISGTAGTRTLTGVSAGAVNAGSTDAVNGGQLFAASATVEAANPVQRTAVPNEVAIVAVGGTGAAPGAAQNVGNVAAGQISAASTDAVNGGQLYATNQTVSTAQNGANQANSGVQNVAGSLGGGASYNPATGAYAGPSYTIQGTAQTTVGGALALLDSHVTNSTGAFQSDNTAAAPSAAASGANATAGGFGAVASNAGSVALGNNARATGANSVALGYGSSDGGAANVVSVGSPGAERRVTNVAPGIAGTDGVNVNQLGFVDEGYPEFD